MESLTLNDYPFLAEMGIKEENNGCYRDGEWVSNGGGVATTISPHTNKPICKTKLASIEDYNYCIAQMQKEKARWAALPAPQRGEIVR